MSMVACIWRKLAYVDADGSLGLFRVDVDIKHNTITLLDFDFIPIEETENEC